jgi:hypothetical protein
VKAKQIFDPILETEFQFFLLTRKERTNGKHKANQEVGSLYQDTAGDRRRFYHFQEHCRGYQG